MRTIRLIRSLTLPPVLRYPPGRSSWHLLQPLLGLCVLFLLSACGGIDLSILNTVTPTPTNTPIPSPTPVPLSVPPGVRPWNQMVIKTICLEQYYTGDLPAFFERLTSMPTIDEAIPQTLNGMNIAILPPGGQCDASLTIEIDGKALSRDYIGGGDLYTGGEVNGSLMIKAPGQITKVFPIQGKEYPPQEIYLLNDSKGPTTPGDYDFRKLYNAPILDALYQIWGPQALFWQEVFGGLSSGMAAENWQDPELLRAIFTEAISDAHGKELAAIVALGETDLKNNPQTLPYLVELLNADGKDELFRRIVVRAISPQLEIQEQAAAKALLDCAIRELHEDCLKNLHRKYGMAWDSSPESLQKWFDEKFPQP